VRQLRKAQDTLGRLHDLQVLQEHVAAVQTKPPTRQVPKGGLAAVASLLEEECRHLHGRYLALAPTLTSAVDKARQVVTDMVRVSSRRDGLTMAKMARPRRTTAPATPTVATARGHR